MAQYFVQGGKKIQMPNSAISGVSGNAVTPEFCSAQFKAFGDRDRFSEVGGWSKLNSALGGKWVLVMSLWDDHYANMLWLDSVYPPEKAGQPGAARGDCPTNSGVPSEVESKYASVCPPSPCFDSLYLDLVSPYCYLVLSRISLKLNASLMRFADNVLPGHCHLLQHSLRTHRLDRQIRGDKQVPVRIWGKVLPGFVWFGPQDSRKCALGLCRNAMVVWDGAVRYGMSPIGARRRGECRKARGSLEEAGEVEFRTWRGRCVSSSYVVRIFDGMKIPSRNRY